MAARRSEALRRIVLTGAPGSGKTVVAEALAKDDGLPFGVIVVPEAATQVYAAHQTRWDRVDLPRRRELQREIYRLQCSQEGRLAAEAYERGCRLLLLDRGTIDGAAYWPDGPAAYWQDLGTSHETELARYDAVLILESAAALGLYDGDRSNAVRFEDAEGALANARLLHELWDPHPHVQTIAAAPSFPDKLAQVRQALLTLVD